MHGQASSFLNSWDLSTEFPLFLPVATVPVPSRESSFRKNVQSSARVTTTRLLTLPSTFPYTRPRRRTFTPLVSGASESGFDGVAILPTRVESTST